MTIRAYHIKRIIPLSLVVLILLALSGCANANDEGTETPVAISTAADLVLPESDWGTLELIARVEQIAAPVFMGTAANTIFAWTGSQDGLARHFARGIQGDSSMLDIIAFFPHQQELFPTPSGALLFWLDRTNEEESIRLQAATLGFDGRRTAGPVYITPQRTRNYAAIGLSPGQFRVVASAGAGEITNLYLYHIDVRGRASGGSLLRIDADYPVLLQDNSGAIHLFWLSNNGRDAYHARFDDSFEAQLVELRNVASANLSVTDAIMDFSAGFDGTSVYLFWSIRRIDDSQITLMSSGQLTDEEFSTASPLVTESDNPVQWAYPARNTQNPLPVVANNEENLWLLWMQNGDIQETEFLTRSGHLIGMPFILATNDSIGVTWSQPANDAYANLFYLTRDRNP